MTDPTVTSDVIAAKRETEYIAAERDRRKAINLDDVSPDLAADIQNAIAVDEQRFQHWEQITQDAIDASTSE